MDFTNEAIINYVKSYTPPVLHLNKNCYISFSAFCPTTGKMKRKKIMLDHFKSKVDQRRYGNQIIKRLTEKLMNGWNPWVEQMQPLEYTPFNDVCSKYRDYLYKQLKENYMREETIISYLSYLNIFSQWVNDKKDIIYIYQFNKQKLSEFLDYIFIERNNTIRTRNNYLAWIKVFCKYLIERSYINSNPTDGVSTIQRRGTNKNRDVIPDNILLKIHNYLMRKNRHFLLACDLLHYCFIRPHEMSLLKIQDINLHAHTIYIHGDIAKNRNDAVITLPSHVIELMIDLNIFSSPGNYYLFSESFAPGPFSKSEKTFRDFWIRYVRNDLKLDARYKFYSLKDTGITNMLKANTDILSVRDQARHSSILITDIYTPKNVKEANRLIVNYKGVL